MISRGVRLRVGAGELAEATAAIHMLARETRTVGREYLHEDVRVLALMSSLSLSLGALETEDIESGDEVEEERDDDDDFLLRDADVDVIKIRVDVTRNRGSKSATSSNEDCISDNEANLA